MSMINHVLSWVEHEKVLLPHITLSLVLVQPRKTCPYITERLLKGCKESNQTSKINQKYWIWKIIFEKKKKKEWKLKTYLILFI